MLYVFFGNDVSEVRQKAFIFAGTLTSDPSTITKITSDTYEEGMIPDFADGVSLFGGEQCAVLDTLTDDVSVFETVVAYAELMQHSKNHFVVIAQTLLTAPKKVFTAHAELMQEYTLEKKEKFNAFSLTDAFLKKDKKSLWLLLNTAWREGVTNEEIIGLLFWQVKILRLVERTGSPDEAGQKPFVYSKAKQALRNFKQGELDDISDALLTMYHEGHTGKRSASYALEQLVLGL